MNKVAKFFWRNSHVGARTRLAFLWALTLTGSILLAGLAPLPSVLATVALCVAMVILTTIFGSWVKKDTGYFHHKWRFFPLPACRDRARHYVVPVVIIGILVVVPTLWIAADAKWGEGFYEVMRGLGYALGVLLILTLAGFGIYAWVDARRQKAAQAKMDRWNEIQAIRDDYEDRLAQAAEREMALKETILKERDRVMKAFSGDFIRILGELTLEYKTGGKPDKFRARVRRASDYALSMVYGNKKAKEITGNTMLVLMDESSPKEPSEVPPASSSDIQ